MWCTPDETIKEHRETKYHIQRMKSSDELEENVLEFSSGETQALPFFIQGNIA